MKKQPVSAKQRNVNQKTSTPQPKTEHYLMPEAKKQIHSLIDQGDIPTILEEAERAHNESHSEYALSILAPYIHDETINELYNKIMATKTHRFNLRYRSLQIELYQINRKSINQRIFSESLNQLIVDASIPTIFSYAEYFTGYYAQYGIFCRYRDLNKAQAHYEKTMRHHLPAKLAYYHLQIRRWPENYQHEEAKKAFQELQKIYQQSAQAEYLMAHCYKTGIGTIQDEVKANARLKSAAERGYKPAQLMWARVDKKNEYWAQEAYKAYNPIFSHESLYDNTLVDFQAQNRDFWQGLSKFRILPSMKMKDTEIAAELGSIKEEIEKNPDSFSTKLNKKLEKLCRNDSLEAMEILINKYLQEIKKQGSSSYEKKILSICESLAEMTYFVANVKDYSQIIKLANALLESCLIRIQAQSANYNMRIVDCSCWILSEIIHPTDNELNLRSNVNLAAARLYNICAEQYDYEGYNSLIKYANQGSRSAREILRFYLTLEDNVLKDISLTLIQGNGIALAEIPVQVPEINYRLAQHFLYGIGVEQDKDKFIYYYGKAKEQNYPYSAYLMAYAYAKGIFFEKNIEEASKLLTESMIDPRFGYIPATALFATLRIEAGDNLDNQILNKIFERTDRTILNCVRANAYLNGKLTDYIAKCISPLWAGDRINYSLIYYLLGTFKYTEYKKTMYSDLRDDAIQYLNDFLRYYDFYKDNYILQDNQAVDEFSFFYLERERIASACYILAKLYYQDFEFVKAHICLGKAIEYGKDDDKNLYIKLIDKCKKIINVKWETAPDLFNGKPVSEILLELYKTHDFESEENNTKLDRLIDRFFAEVTEDADCELIKELIAKLYKKKGNLAYTYTLLSTTANEEKFDNFLADNKHQAQVHERIARNALYQKNQGSKFTYKRYKLPQDLYVEAFNKYYGILGTPNHAEALKLLQGSIEQHNYAPAAILYLIHIMETLVDYREDPVTNAIIVLKNQKNLDEFGYFILYRACRIFPHLVKDDKYENYLNKAVEKNCKPALMYAAVQQNRQENIELEKNITNPVGLKLMKTNEQYDIKMLEIIYWKRSKLQCRSELPSNIIPEEFPTRITNFLQLSQNEKKHHLDSLIADIRKGNYTFITTILHYFFPSPFHPKPYENNPATEEAIQDCLSVICEFVEMGLVEYRTEILCLTKDYLDSYFNFICDHNINLPILSSTINLIFLLNFIEKNPEYEIYLALLQLDDATPFKINIEVNSNIINQAVAERNKAVLTFLSFWYIKAKLYDRACILNFLKDIYEPLCKKYGEDYSLAHALITQDLTTKSKILFSEFFATLDYSLSHVLFLQYLAIEYGFLLETEPKINILIKAAEKGYKPAQLMLAAHYIHNIEIRPSINQNAIETYLWEYNKNSPMVHYLRYQYGKNIRFNKNTNNALKLACEDKNYFALVIYELEKKQSDRSKQIKEERQYYSKETIFRCLLSDKEEFDYLQVEILYERAYFTKILAKHTSNENPQENKVIPSAPSIEVAKNEKHRKNQEEYPGKKKLYSNTNKKLLMHKENLEESRANVGKLVAQFANTNPEIIAEWNANLDTINAFISRINAIPYTKWPDFDDKTSSTELENVLSQITSDISKMFSLNKEIAELHENISTEKINHARNQLEKIKNKQIMRIDNKLENNIQIEELTIKEPEMTPPIIKTNEKEVVTQLAEPALDNRHQYEVTLELPAKEKADPEKSIIEQAKAHDPLPEWREVLRQFNLLKTAAKGMKTIRTEENLPAKARRSKIRNKQKKLDSIISNLHLALTSKELENKTVDFPAISLIEDFVKNESNDKAELRSNIIKNKFEIQKFFDNMITKLSESEEQIRQANAEKKQLAIKQNYQSLATGYSFWQAPDSAHKIQIFKTILKNIVHKVETLLKNFQLNPKTNLDSPEGKLIFLQYYYHFLRLCCAMRMAKEETIPLFKNQDFMDAWVHLRNTIAHSGQEIIKNRTNYAQCFMNVTKNWNIPLEQYINSGKKIDVNILKNPILERMVRTYKNNKNEKPDTLSFIHYCIDSLTELHNQLNAILKKINEISGRIGKETLLTIFDKQPEYVSAIKAIIALLGDVINDYETQESWIINFPMREKIIKARNEICHELPNVQDTNNIILLSWAAFDDVTHSDLINILKSLDKIKAHCEKEFPINQEKQMLTL